MAVTIRAVRIAANTSTGTQDFTVSGFGTPVAALFLMSDGTVNSTEVGGGAIMIGATDGTRSRVACVARLDAAATTNTASSQDASNCVRLIDDTSAVVSEAAFSAWITDGVRINWTTVTANGELVTCILFGGTDIDNAYVNHFTPDAVQDNVVDVTDPGFEPNVIIAFACTNCTSAQSRANTSALQTGFITNDGAAVLQTGYTGSNRDGRSTVDVRSTMLSAHGMASSSSAGADISHLLWGTFDANGFSVTTQDGAIGSTHTVAYLALNLSTNSDAWTGIVDTPTSTGNDAQTGPSFEPEAVFMLYGMNATTVQHEADDDGGGQGIGFFNANEEFCVSCRDDDAATTSDNSSVSESVAIRQNDINASTAMYRATFVSMDTNGWTLNYATVDGTARRTAVLAIQTVAAGGVTMPKFYHHYQRNTG